MNVAVRTAIGVDGVLIVLGAWCPTCQLESLPHDRHGTCLFCDTVIYGTLAERGPRLDIVGTADVRQPDRPPRSASVKRGRPKKWTRSQIIAALQAFHAQHGRTPTSADLPIPRAIRREFGTHGEACDAAGLLRPPRGANAQTGPVEHRYGKWTRDAAVEAVQAFHTLHGYQPVSGEAGQVHGLPSFSSAKRLFGSWNQMIAAAGFTPYLPRSSAGAKTAAFRDRNPGWREQRFDGVVTTTGEAA